METIKFFILLMAIIALLTGIVYKIMDTIDVALERRTIRKRLRNL